MKKNKILCFLLIFVLFNSKAQDTLNYTSIFIDSVQELTKEEIKFSKTLDDSNQIQLRFGYRFNDSIKILIQSTLLYKGIIKTNYSISAVNQTWWFNRKSEFIDIIFSDKYLMRIAILDKYKYIKVDFIKDKYIVTYSISPKSQPNR